MSLPITQAKCRDGLRAQHATKLYALEGTRGGGTPESPSHRMHKQLCFVFFIPYGVSIQMHLPALTWGGEVGRMLLLGGHRHGSG